MTAEATHVNEIVATFNKAVAADAKVTLTKGTSTVTNTAKIAEDGKSATITLTGKLTDGTYTVTVVAGEETVSAEVVAQSEKLTSFTIGTTVKETSKDANHAKATLSYKALNQYGDMINYTAEQNSVTVSPGKVTKVTGCKTTGAGEITIEEIPTMYAIPGQSEFTVVIVDTLNGTGTTMNAKAVYGSSATASQFTSAGIYSVNKAAFKDIADGDTISSNDTTVANSNFQLLLTAKDQYDDDMDADKVAALASDGAISVSVAGGLTNVKTIDLKGQTASTLVKEINGTKYFAVPLFYASGDSQKKGANAGTYTVNIVNNTKGIVYTGEFTVTSGVVIESIQISPKDTIYAGQENEFEYTATSTDGKDITDYATLKSVAVESNLSTEKNAFAWKQNTDGSAKLVYTPVVMASATTARDFTKSEVRSCTLKANKEVSGKYLVKSTTYNVYYQRRPVAVTGLASSATTVTTNTAGSLEVKLEDLVILDQYQNPYAAADLKGNTTIGNEVFVTSKSAISELVSVSAANIDITSNINAHNVWKEFGTKVTMAGITSTVTPEKLNFAVSNDAAYYTKAMENGNDYTASFLAGDSNKVGGLYVASVNGGCPLYVASIYNTAKLVGKDTQNAGTKSIQEANENARADYGLVTVKGTVNGKTVTIEPNQYAFVGANKDGQLELKGLQSLDLAGKVLTETREFSIVVNTEDGPQTITGKVDVSNEPITAKTVAKKDDATLTATVASNATTLYSYTSADELFTTKSQYNSVVTGEALLTFKPESVVVSGAGITLDGQAVANGTKLDAGIIGTYLNGSNRAQLTFNAAGQKLAGGNSGNDALVVTATVEARVNGTNSSAKQTIKVTITF